MFYKCFDKRISEIFWKQKVFFLMFYHIILQMFSALAPPINLRCNCKYIERQKDKFLLSHGSFYTLRAIRILIR